MKPFISKAGSIAGTLVILVFLGLTELVHRRSHEPSDFDVQLASLPNQFGEWTAGDAQPLDKKSHDILQLDQYVLRSYHNARGESVFVYIGYWKKQSGEHQAAKHSPLMCLPANGWKISSPVERNVAIEGDNDGQPARRLFATIKDQSLLYYYWFFSGDQTYLDETEALLHIMRETLVHARSDGGIIEVSSAIDPSLSQDDAIKKSEAVLAKFVKEFSPILSKVVNQKRIALPE